MKSLLLPVGLAVLFLCPLTDGRSGEVIPSSTPDAKPTADASAAGVRVIAEARAAGQRGLDALMAANQDLIERMRSGATPLSDPSAAKLRTTLDAVAKQRDAHASGLYWYTDLDAAKVEAQASGKRILSLRLLGNLDEEFSCANSRFFRTALYANKEVSDYLRQNFVLHWKSVRPAPKLTIDMGDGRRLERTITGNSIHYVLAPSGYVLDAIPGLYGPETFMHALRATEPEVFPIPGLSFPGGPESPRPIEPFHTALQADAVNDATATALAKYHGQAADAICHRWLSSAIVEGMFGEAISHQWDKEGGRNLMPRLLPSRFPLVPTRSSPPSAILARRTPRPSRKAAPVNRRTSHSRRRPRQSHGAANIRRAEVQLVATPALGGGGGNADGRETHGGGADHPPRHAGVGSLRGDQGGSAPGKSLPSRMTPALWKRMGALASRSRYMHLELDEASRRFMMAKLPAKPCAPRTCEGRRHRRHTPFARTLRNFEAAMAEDTIRNEFLFHSQIHQWLEDPVTGSRSPATWRR